MLFRHYFGNTQESSEISLNLQINFSLCTASRYIESWITLQNYCFFYYSSLCSVHLCFEKT